MYEKLVFLEFCRHRAGVLFPEPSHRSAGAAASVAAGVSAQLPLGRKGAGGEMTLESILVALALLAEGLSVLGVSAAGKK